ncbi:protein Spindly-like isoform X2 [Hippocampus zosterae]|uniref:protein Spindly-like isoform X2 n=1 Tax=Hippocampus zosterae TaxID=109293 RepID=UPI00223DC25D|nr:protein Spindly-like isoform X2 [Hippocampus zosterae]XP_051933539.1 protein Spindly-like isoform X2 [Hippocampus zosterae]
MSDPATDDDIHRLRGQLRQKEEQVQQAAHAGLDLLNQLSEMQTRLEEQRIEMTSALEDLKQDKYTLQNEVALKTRLMESLQSEVDSLKKQHRQNIDDEKEKLERSHRTTLHQLNNKIMHLQSSLDESQLIEKQQKEKLDLQTELLKNKMDELRILNEDTQRSSTSELMDLQKKVLELENIKLELELALKETQYKEQQLQLTNSTLQHNLKQTTEDRNKEAATWCAVLEKSREVNRELQLHLETVLQQAQDPKSKGNSLFAELEDKRAEMEKKLISMKVQYDSLQAQYVFNKHQSQRMKVHIATLMQLQCSRTDPSQLDRLHSILLEKNDEIQHLNAKLERLEKIEVLLKTKGSNIPPSEIGHGHDETFYTDLLKMKLDNAIKDVERLGEELSQQRMKSLLESQKALELERKLFTQERLLKQTQCDKMRLQLQVEKLQHKYEPKKSTDLSQPIKKEKLPVDTVPSYGGTTLDKDKQISKETDITHEMLQPETDKSPTGFDMEPKSVKRVKIDKGDPLLITNPSSHVTRPNVLIKEDHQKQDETEESKEGDHHKPEETEERGKKQNFEIMHVRAENSMASQCSQQ